MDQSQEKSGKTAPSMFVGGDQNGQKSKSLVDERRDSPNSIPVDLSFTRLSNIWDFNQL